MEILEFVDVLKTDSIPCTEEDARKLLPPTDLFCEEGCENSCDSNSPGCDCESCDSDGCYD